MQCTGRHTDIEERYLFDTDIGMKKKIFIHVKIILISSTDILLTSLLFIPFLPPFSMKAEDIDRNGNKQRKTMTTHTRNVDSN